VSDGVEVPSMSLDPALALTAALVLAGIFAAAGLTKLRAPEAFAAVIENYRVLPNGLVPVTARALPVIELAAAIGLAFPATRSPASGVIALLLIAFALAMAINLGRGRRDIDCGCFIGLLRQKLSWPLVARNILLAMIAVALAVGTVSARGLGALDGLTAVAGAGALLLIYVAYGRLFGLAPRIQKGAAA
jgi:uncharacterized membrane protein YphA (DoxX/SURF4 family)